MKCITVLRILRDECQNGGRLVCMYMYVHIYTYTHIYVRVCVCEDVFELRRPHDDGKLISATPSALARVQCTLSTLMWPPRRRLNLPQTTELYFPTKVVYQQGSPHERRKLVCTTLLISNTQKITDFTTGEAGRWGFFV